MARGETASDNFIIRRSLRTHDRKVLFTKLHPSGQELRQSRPWRRYRDRKEDHRKLVSTGPNYKVYADVGLSYACTRLLRTLFDTGAGHSFVRENELSDGRETKMSTESLPIICDAKKNPLQMLGIVKLHVLLSTTQVFLKLTVSNTLAALAIVEAYFCNQYVTAMGSKQKLVELDNCECIPTIPKLRGRTRSQPLLPDGLVFPIGNPRPSSLLYVANRFTARAHANLGSC